MPSMTSHRVFVRSTSLLFSNLYEAIPSCRFPSGCHNQTQQYGRWVCLHCGWRHRLQAQGGTPLAPMQVWHWLHKRLLQVLSISRTWMSCFYSVYHPTFITFRKTYLDSRFVHTPRILGEIVPQRKTATRNRTSHCDIEYFEKRIT